MTGVRGASLGKVLKFRSALERFLDNLEQMHDSFDEAYFISLYNIFKGPGDSTLRGKRWGRRFEIVSAVGAKL